MLFNTSIFAAFFLAFFVVFKFLAKSRTQKLWAVTIGSLLFYATWDYRFVPLLIGTALLDFCVARAIQHESRPARRRLLLIASISANLAVLAIFKYANFILRSSSEVVAITGLVVATPALDIVLPAGISFYTFQSMSYTIDVYRGQLRAREAPMEFLAGVTFFPHLVAGPIIRASVLLPQFDRLAPLPWRSIRVGFLLVSAGLLNKTIADHLALAANAAFAGGPRDALASWTGALAFTGQVYGDFAGYSDIAIGVAALLGFVVPPNFDLPYLASSPIDFWHRWHISFSSWLRDYLWLPLSIRNTRFPLVNLLLTMVLGGLWHGANWTFVVWGAYHGVLLMASHATRKVLRLRPHALMRVGQIALTFYLVVVGWVFFRAESLRAAVSMLRAMHGGVVRVDRDALLTLGLVVAGLVVTHLVSSLVREKASRLHRSPLLWVAVTLFMTLSFVFSGRVNAFIYFQF